MHALEILILFFVAFFIFRHLWNSLGKDDGPVRPPRHTMPFPAPVPQQPESPVIVSTIPPIPTSMKDFYIDGETYERLQPVTEYIEKIDNGFLNEERFLQGAQRFYTMVLETFQKGNIDTIRDYLSSQVAGEYTTLLDSYKKQGYVYHATLIHMSDAKIQDIDRVGDDVTIKVLFRTEQIVALKDAQGIVIQGNSEKIQKLKDVWTFTRRLGSKDKNWIMTAHKV